MINLVQDFVIRELYSPGWWDGMCHDLAYAVSNDLKDRQIGHRMVWIRAEKEELLVPVTAPDSAWRFHVALEVGGLIHDLWFGQVVSLQDYKKAMFPTQKVKVFRGMWDFDQIKDQTQSPQFSLTYW